ncbi:MAG: ankyrin repeat domain-containing protein [Pyrinomonadaceae bacterium]
MTTKVLINQIKVENPCSVAWDSMVGNDQIRFCEHCNLSVNNLSELTQKQVLQLISKSDGRLCVSYLRRPDGSLITGRSHGRTLGRLHQIGRRASRVAAGAFTATLSVTGAAAQGTQCSSGSTCDIPVTASRWALGGAVSGIVRDPKAEVIPGATVSLTDDEKTFVLVTSSSRRGEYRFEGLKAGSYNLRIEAPGFTPREGQSVYVPANGETQLDQTLEIERIEASVEGGGLSGEKEVFVTQGAVAFVAPADPLIRAAQQDDLPRVAELIAGRDVNLRDKASHTTALEHAVRNANREMVQLLISAGADVNAKSNVSETVLMMLDSDATSDLAWDLINAGAKVNAKDLGGNTPLIEAAEVNNPDLLKTLLEAGAEVNARNKRGQTALMKAAAEGLVNNLRALILAGADLNTLDSEGKNALCYATDSDHAAVARLLRTQGADQTVAVKRKEND